VIRVFFEYIVLKYEINHEPRVETGGRKFVFGEILKGGSKESISKSEVILEFVECWNLGTD
jgi:hypothetical protein